MQYRIPFIKPSLPSADEMAEDYRQIIASNWFTNFGPLERQFSTQVGEYVGQGYTAVTFSSATAALLASVLAVLGRGDNTKYVIMPSFTFVAGADALVWCGYKPYFIDIETNGLHMSIAEAKKVLKKNDTEIAGILFCNAFGVGTNNIAEWEALSKEFAKPLVIDSAAGFGSLYSSNNKVGSAGDCEIFSFHATKSFAIGEGGAVVTRDTKLAEELHAIENFGFDHNKSASQLGFNGKLQEINAAIGLRQLKKFDKSLATRRGILKTYKNGLDSNKYYLQDNAENASLCFATVIVKEAHRRNAMLDSLQKAGIDAKTYYSPSIHKQQFFKDQRTGGTLANTELIESSVLSLPVYDSLSNEDTSLIIQILNS